MKMKCLDCDKDIKRINNAQKRCSSCAKEVQLLRSRIAATKYNHSTQGRRIRKKYRNSYRGRKLRAKYENGLKGQAARERRNFLGVLKPRCAIRGGRPDAQRIEQKIAGDQISAMQWRRAAWWESRHPEKPFRIFYSEMHEAAGLEKGHFVSFANRARQLGLSWGQLVKKEQKLDKLFVRR